MKKLFSIALLILFLGCTQTQEVIEAGDIVSLHYTGTLSDGTEFDSSVGGDPLIFTAGAGEMISGFDDAVIGMSVGEEKTFTIAPEDAYGNVDSEKLIEYNLTDIEESIDDDLYVGMQLSTSNGLMGTITEITNNSVTIDFNHPLAGQSLTFTITIVSIEK